MSITISFFNNKGGVGKTTLLFHVAHRLADEGKTVLMVDCDSQCNLTAYALQDDEIEQAWEEEGNSIFKAIEQVARTVGDIRNRAPSMLEEHLYLVPGDLRLSDFEDRLGDTWNSAKGGAEAALRAQSAIYRSVKKSVEKCSADIVLVDLGPNLGALNRAVLGGSDFMIVPVAPDLFSIRGTENLGSKLVTWRQEWDQCNSTWKGTDLQIPKGRPKFLGYVVQNHKVRNTPTGMTRGWELFGERVAGAIQANIVNTLTPLGQVRLSPTGNYNLGLIHNLHSLIPYSLEARKPVYKCNGTDGLTGAHISSARESAALFDGIVAAITSLTAADVA